VGESPPHEEENVTHVEAECVPLFGARVSIGRERGIDRGAGLVRERLDGSGEHVDRHEPSSSGRG
jgi:hypothetical protein